MNNKTYKDENGIVYRFDLDKFKSTLDSNRRAKGMKAEDYVREVADEMSSSYDTVLGWKKGKNSPQDLETVHELEEVLELSEGALLFSKEDKLKKERDGYMGQALMYKKAAIELKSELDKYKNEKNIQPENFQFNRRLNAFNLRYEGFSNLIDMIIGINHDPKLDEGPSTYAEELDYIFTDYLRENSFAEILGYKQERSIEEVDEYLKNYKEDGDEKFVNWLNYGQTDKEGKHLYDEDGGLNLPGNMLWEKLKKSPLLSRADKRRASALIDELMSKWNKYDFPYACLFIVIQVGGVEVEHYTFGPGYCKPTDTERIELIKKLLFVSDGDISFYTLENATQFHVDQFEMDIRIVFDLMKLFN